MGRVQKLIRRIIGPAAGAPASVTPVSSGYSIVDTEVVESTALDGWLEDSVARTQHGAYQPLLAEMHAGNPRLDFTVAARAILLTGLENPTLLEVGCGSGYYSEVLSFLSGAAIQYTGLDYSPAMVEVAREHYPGSSFVVGDATALPFERDSFDIVMNGVSLMHILGYRDAIAESRRVARRWCIYHTVPLLMGRQTTVLTKSAYGSPTVEVIFNENELRGLLQENGLIIRHTLDSIPYDLSSVLGEPTFTKTFVCEVQ
jgi:SAM-dependent methyltransferase